MVAAAHQTVTYTPTELAGLTAGTTYVLQNVQSDDSLSLYEFETRAPVHFSQLASGATVDREHHSTVWPGETATLNPAAGESIWVWVGNAQEVAEVSVYRRRGVIPLVVGLVLVVGVLVRAGRTTGASGRARRTTRAGMWCRTSSRIRTRGRRRMCITRASIPGMRTRRFTGSRALTPTRIPRCWSRLPRPTPQLQARRGMTGT